MTYQNVMLDIECLDTAPTNRAIIVSIGMVKFDLRGPEDSWETLRDLGRTYYTTLPLQIQLDANRTVGGSTLQWWFKQSTKVQAELLALDEDHPQPDFLITALSLAMEQMQDFLAPFESDTQSVDGQPRMMPYNLWGKPAHFDAPKVETLFTDFDYTFPVPWYCYKCMS